MGKYERIKDEWNTVFDKEKTKKQVFRSVCKWIYKLRSLVLAIPVALVAAVLAVRNMALLPAKVGFSMDASGEFTYVVVKSVAVMGPLAVTAVCLLLMFCSKRVVYPWLISIFSLALPIVILLLNTFNG